MTEQHRHVTPDPESMPPELVPAPADMEGALAVERPPESVPGYARALSVVLPGAGHIAVGAWGRGMAFLLPWVLLLAIGFVARTRILAIPENGTLEDYVALVTLVVALVFIWVQSSRDLAASGRPRAIGGDSQWRIAARLFRRDHLAMTGLTVLGALYLIALLAPFLAPYDPIAQENIAQTSYLPPSAAHWLGTDQFGRDILSRILYGARISLSIAFIAVGISITLGTLLGAIAGYMGGKVDAAIMRFTDMVLAFPRLVLLIIIIALFSPSIALIIIVLGLTQWPSTARVVRGEVLSLRERDYIHAAQALGMSRTRIILRHLIPNVLAPVIVSATLGLGNTIVLEAGLSFLGLGVQPPTPSWGNMVADGRQNLIGAWWVATFPGLAIVFTVLAFNLVGDGLRDALDPRMRT